MDENVCLVRFSFNQKPADVNPVGVDEMVSAG